MDGAVTSSVSVGIRVGGLVGLSSGTITNSRSKGSVTGLFWVGGLVGELLSGGSINESYSNSSVSVITDGDILGGLVGIVRVSSTIENTYSTGEVLQSSGTLFGGLIGLNQGGTITASFWDTQTSGQGDSAGGTGKTTAEMQMQSTFDPPWDFTNV